MKSIYIFSLLVILASCENDTVQLKFDSKKWKQYRDLDEYPYRESMLRDILESKRFVGQNYSVVIDSLGQSELSSRRGVNELWYPVTTDYGRDIDPVYTKHLILTMDNDSTIERVEVREWKKWIK